MTYSYPYTYKDTQFKDSLGRVITEAHFCEFCNKRMPVQVWDGPDFNSPTLKDKYRVLMTQIELSDGRKAWRCNKCNVM